MDRPDPNLLTPGVLDGYAKRAFKYGACAALALALHESTSWPIVAITDAHNVEDGKAGGGSALHWTVRHPSGALLDVDGLHPQEALVQEYSAHADDGEAAAGLSTREDLCEWYIEAQGEPISIELARTFVAPLLARLT